MFESEIEILELESETVISVGSEAVLSLKSMLLKTRLVLSERMKP